MGQVANDLGNARPELPSPERPASHEVDRALVQVILTGGDLQDVTDELVRLLGAAVFATTPDGRVLAASGSERELALARGSSRFESSGRFRTEEEPPGVHGHEHMPGNHAVVPILAGALDHGRIAAFSSTGALAERDLHILERAATVAALAITKSLAVAAVESKYRGDFLRDLVTGRAGPIDAAVEHCASLGWRIDRPVVVVVAELDPRAPATRSGSSPGRGLELRPALERFTSAWTQVVGSRDPMAPVAGISTEVVAILGVPGDGDVARLVRDCVGAVRGDGGGGRRSFSTGASRIAATPERIPGAYEQARTAVAVGRQVDGPGSLAHFDGLGVFRLLSLVPDTAELRSFLVETLGELATREDPDAEDLRRTLRVLLETNLNVAETARRMHFHYNTLRYRIGKLQRMIGPFTDDPHLRLDVTLALRVLQMRGIRADGGASVH